MGKRTISAAIDKKEIAALDQFTTQENQLFLLLKQIHPSNLEKGQESIQQSKCISINYPVQVSMKHLLQDK